MPSIDTSSTSRSSSTNSSSSTASGAGFSVNAIRKSYEIPFGGTHFCPSEEDLGGSGMPTTTNGAVELYYDTFGDRSNPTFLLINGLGSQCINYADDWCERFVGEGYH